METTLKHQCFIMISMCLKNGGWILFCVCFLFMPCPCSTKEQSHNIPFAMKNVLAMCFAHSCGLNPPSGLLPGLAMLESMCAFFQAFNLHLLLSHLFFASCLPLSGSPPLPPFPAPKSQHGAHQEKYFPFFWCSQ